MIQRYSQPGKNGHFGAFGGQYAPETLMPALRELEQAYREVKRDPAFKRELNELLREYVGRETPLYHAARLTERLGGARIYLKREDLCHTGAHKINNTVGQVLLAKHMGKKRVIAETGAGQHGVATATVAAMLGIECEVYMGTEDMDRQALNVYRMRLLAPNAPACITAAAPSRTPSPRPCATGPPTCAPPITCSARCWAATPIR